MPPGFVQGTLIANRYRLERRAGAGGMGAVFRAHDTQLDTTVAVKVVHPELAEMCGPERLLQEARAAARIHHPAVVRVFDFGRHESGHAYIVMEWLDGVSLRTHLQKAGRLSPERAVALVLPVLEGLSALHARGIVHRDLKPDNVVLARIDGGRLQPKIVDFGIATMRRQRSAPGPGHVVGTPEYMSPEQAEGLDDVDERSDVWGATALLYELCTDEYAFGGDSARAVLENVLRAPAPDLAARAKVDRELAGIVARGFEKDRTRRWQSAYYLGHALAEWLASRRVREDACGASLSATWGVRAPASQAVPLVRPARARGRTRAAALALGCLAAGLALGSDGRATPRALARGLGSAVIVLVPFSSEEALASGAHEEQLASVAPPEPARAPAARSSRGARQRNVGSLVLPPPRRERPEDVDFGF